MDLIKNKNQTLYSVLKTAFLIIILGLVGYAAGYLFEKRQNAASFSAPGPNPSVLCLRLEFPDHKMRLLDLEWRVKLERLVGQANTYWNEQLYGTFEAFQTPEFTDILTLPESADSYLGDLDKIYEDAAKVSNLSFKDYDHVILSYPSITQDDKAWGAPGKVWYPGEVIEPHKFVHEIGHSFGLGHCALHYRDPDHINPTAPPSTDPWFMMGEPSFLFFTPLPLPMRYQLGALGENNVPKLTGAPGEKTTTLRIHDFRKTPKSGQTTGYQISGDDHSVFWISYLTPPDKIFEAGGLSPASGLIIQRSQQYLVESFAASREPHDTYPDLIPKRLGAKKGETFSPPNQKFTVEFLDEGTDSDGHAWADITVQF